jgi:hypothetical protein
MTGSKRDPENKKNTRSDNPLFPPTVKQASCSQADNGAPRTTGALKGGESGGCAGGGDANAAAGG